MLTNASTEAERRVSRRPLRRLVSGLLLAASLSVAQQRLPELPPDLSADPEAQGFADLLFAQGMVQLAAKEYATALPLFEKAATAWPGDATYAYFAALCKLRLGRHGEAVRALEATLPPAACRIPPARIRYDLGEARYLAGDVQGAEREFRAALKLDEKDGWAHYYLGLILFTRGESDAAIGEFGRAGRLEPSLAGESSYFSAIAAHQGGDLAAARKHFQKVLESNAGHDLTSSGRRWLDSMKPPSEAPSPPPVEVRVGLSIESDDNPGRVNDTLGGLPGSDSDIRGVLRFRLGAQPLVRQDGWTLGLGVNGYASRHQDFSEADQAGIGGVFQAAWGSDPLGYVNGPLGYARVTPGEDRFGWILQTGGSYFNLDEESFRRDFEAAGSFLARQPGSGKTQLDLQYADRTFFGPFFGDLTGKVRTVRLGQYFNLGSRPGRYVRVAVARASTSTREEGLDYDTTQFLAEAALPVSRRWTFFVYGSRSTDDYSRESASIYGGEREDDRSELSGTAVAALWPHSYAMLRYSWVDQDVDPEAALLSYDRKIASTGITVYW